MEHTPEEHVMLDEASKRRRFLNAAILPIIAVVVLWCIHLFNITYDLELYRWGIYPRTLMGLKGIFTSPLIHGDLKHLFNNTLPVLFLGWGLMYFYPRIAGKVVLGAWLVANSWVWISARQNFHIGASGVIYGMAAFLFTSGVLRRQRTLMALSLLIVFLYGSMVWGILPIVPQMSWEGHLWGMISGVAMAFLFRQVPPAVSDPRPIHFDEDEEEEEEQPDAPAHDVHGLGSTPLRVIREKEDEQQQDPPPPEEGAKEKWNISNSWQHGSTRN